MAGRLAQDGKTKVGRTLDFRPTNVERMSNESPTKIRRTLDENSTNIRRDELNHRYYDGKR
jgi:hypothetical protein